MVPGFESDVKKMASGGGEFGSGGGIYVLVGN